MPASTEAHDVSPDKSLLQVVFVGVYLLTPASKPVNSSRDLESGLVESRGDGNPLVPPLIDLPHMPHLHARTGSDVQHQDVSEVG